MCEKMRKAYVRGVRSRHLMTVLFLETQNKDEDDLMSSKRMDLFMSEKKGGNEFIFLYIIVNIYNSCTYSMDSAETENEVQVP